MTLLSTLFQIGTIAKPAALKNFDATNPGKGIANIIQIVMLILISVSGVYAVFNFILAGLGFISAGGDPSKIEKAWTKIWQSIVGLLIAVGAFTLAALVGQLIFNNWKALLYPSLPTL